MNYGYGNCRLYRDEAPPELPKIQVLAGVRHFVKAGYREGFSFLGLHGEDFSAIEKELQLEGPVEAPVGEGEFSVIWSIRWMARSWAGWP